MKEVTKDSLKAFFSSKSFRKSNMEIIVQNDKTIMTLFGNEIAYIYHNAEKTLKIRNAGWFSETTKERLNALPNVHISQKSYNWFLNGSKWDGSTITVCNLSTYQQEYLEKMKNNKETLDDLNRYVELSLMSTEDFLKEVLYL